MDNYEAIAYACIAIRTLKEDGKEVNESSIRGRMLYLMDRYSETEIWEMYSGS